MSRDARLAGIYCIVNASHRCLEIAGAALSGGVRIVQYRAKGAFVVEQAQALRDVTRAHGALFIINDDWRAALDCDADGVHLGPDDAGFARVSEVRAAFGNRIVGLSCGTPDEAHAAHEAGADYIGVGAVYATASKEDAGEPIGIAGLQRVAAAAPLPVAAIGGITAQRLSEVRATGVAMAAVLAAISDAAHPQAAAEELARLWREEARQ
jgi:thiamine-phosphate pyrophosphorylase